MRSSMAFQPACGSLEENPMRLSTLLILLTIAAGATYIITVQRDAPIVIPHADIPPPTVTNVPAIVEPEIQPPKAVGIDELMALCEGYKESIGATLDYSKPPVEIGSEADFRLVSGRVIRGRLKARSDTNVVIATAGGETAINCGEIDPSDRLLLDTDYRRRWIHFRAIAIARRDLADAGLELEALPAANSDTQDILIELGSIPALIKAGEDKLRGRNGEKDLSLAFLYYSCAAMQGDPRGQYAVGRMYYGGLGIPQNTGEALKWISIAASSNDPSALAFIAQHKHTEQVIAAARREYALQQGNERAQYAARLDAIQAKESTAQTAGRSSSGFAAPRRVGRTFTQRYENWTDSSGTTYIRKNDGTVSRVIK